MERNTNRIPGAVRLSRTHAAPQYRNDPEPAGPGPDHRPLLTNPNILETYDVHTEEDNSSKAEKAVSENNTPDRTPVVQYHTDAYATGGLVEHYVNMAPAPTPAPTPTPTPTP